jgi:hypothetical protein
VDLGGGVGGCAIAAVNGQCGGFGTVTSEPALGGNSNVSVCAVPVVCSHDTICLPSCISDADCSIFGTAAPVCDASDHICKACVHDTDCTGELTACVQGSALNGAGQGDFSDVSICGCSTSSECPADAPQCSDIHTCGCTADEQCSSQPGGAGETCIQH